MSDIDFNQLSHYLVESLQVMRDCGSRSINSHSLQILGPHHCPGATAAGSAPVADNGSIFTQLLTCGADAGGYYLRAMPLLQPLLCFLSVQSPELRRIQDLSLLIFDVDITRFFRLALDDDGVEPSDLEPRPEVSTA